MEHNFEDIEIKENAIELLENALKHKRKKCMIGTGSMTDPYIPLEMEIGNVRKALSSLTSHVFPTQIDKQVPRCSKQQSTCFML